MDVRLFGFAAAAGVLTACGGSSNFPPGVIGILHVDAGTDYVFRDELSPVGGSCSGWKAISIQPPGQDAAGTKTIMCWQDRGGMLHTATALNETEQVMPMRGITEPY